MRFKDFVDINVKHSKEFPNEELQIVDVESVEGEDTGIYFIKSRIRGPLEVGKSIPDYEKNSYYKPRVYFVFIKGEERYSGMNLQEAYAVYQSYRSPAFISKDDADKSLAAIGYRFSHSIVLEDAELERMNWSSRYKKVWVYYPQEVLEEYRARFENPYAVDWTINPQRLRIYYEVYVSRNGFIKFCFSKKLNPDIVPDNIQQYVERWNGVYSHDFTKEAVTIFEALGGWKIPFNVNCYEIDENGRKVFNPDGYCPICKQIPCEVEEHESIMQSVFERQRRSKIWRLLRLDMPNMLEPKDYPDFMINGGMACDSLDSPMCYYCEVFNYRIYQWSGGGIEIYKQLTEKIDNIEVLNFYHYYYISPNVQIRWTPAARMIEQLNQDKLAILCNRNWGKSRNLVKNAVNVAFLRLMKEKVIRCLLRDKQIVYDADRGQYVSYDFYMWVKNREWEKPVTGEDNKLNFEFDGHIINRVMESKKITAEEWAKKVGEDYKDRKTKSVYVVDRVPPDKFRGNSYDTSSTYYVHIINRPDFPVPLSVGDMENAVKICKMMNVDGSLHFAQGI